MITLLLSVAWAGSVSLDRVDLIAAGPGTFVNYDVPVFGSDVTRSAIRFVEQVQPVWRTPVEHLYVGTSITSQSLIWDAPIREQWPVNYVAALETSLLAPRGLRVGAAAIAGPVRFELGVSAITPTGWRRFDYNTWTVMPTLAIGIQRKRDKPLPMPTG